MLTRRIRIVLVLGLATGVALSAADLALAYRLNSKAVASAAVASEVVALERLFETSCTSVDGPIDPARLKPNEQLGIILRVMGDFHDSAIHIRFRGDDPDFALVTVLEILRWQTPPPAMLEVPPELVRRTHKIPCAAEHRGSLSKWVRQLRGECTMVSCTSLTFDAVKVTEEGGSLVEVRETIAQDYSVTEPCAWLRSVYAVVRER